MERTVSNFEDKTLSAVQFFNEREQARRDKANVNLFEAGAAGLAGALVAKLLFGNRGS